MGTPDLPRGPVVCVAGNHEHYDRYLDTTLSALETGGSPLCEAGHQASCSDSSYVLERMSIAIGDVRFLKCTFWTGFELFTVASLPERD